MSAAKVIKASTLIIGDEELNCNCKDLTLDDLNISHIGFSTLVTDKFDIIIYDGSKGTKIIKSTHTKTGIVK